MKKLLSFVLALLIVLPAFAALPFVSAAADPFIYLSDETPSSMTIGYDTLHFDTNLEGSKMSLYNAGDKIIFDKGLCVHAVSSVSFDISGYDVTRFRATVGMDDGSYGYKEYAGADFTVAADGVDLFAPVNLVLTDEAYEIDVAIPAGTRTLTLKNGDGNDGSTWSEHCVWGNARILLDPNADGQLQSVDASVSKSFLTVGQTAQILLDVHALGGGSVSNYTKNFSSSNTSAATVSSSGVITAVGQGSTTITCTVSKNGKTATDSLTVTCVPASSNSSFIVTSPDGSLQILLTNASAGLTYSVAKSGTVVVEPSTIGHLTEEVSFTSGLSFVRKSTAAEINETYRNYSGDRAYGSDHCTEQSFTFTKSGYDYTVTVRAYEDGFAVRSSISKSAGGSFSLTVTDDKTAVKLPSGTKLWGTQLPDKDLLWGNSYESGFPMIDISEASGKNILKAPLAKVSDDLYVLLSEADLYGDPYIGSVFRGIGGNTLEYTAAPQTLNETGVLTRNQIETASASELRRYAALLEIVPISGTSFTFPWRYGVVGDLATIVESDLTDNLNPRATEDFSWVEPGFTSWMWLTSGAAGQHDPDNIRKYIDLSAEFGWKYLILDDGWQPGSHVPGKVVDGYYDWIDEILDYAESKGVGLFAWVRLGDLDTPQERETLLEWGEMGFKGIKFDFVCSESVETLQTVKAIYETCAEAHLLVNEHGGNIPTGERSTWPNVINRESVKGQEYGGVWCSDSTVWPYTRAAVGPTDITPSMAATGSNTMSHQIALLTVVEAGTPCMASAPEVYYNSNVKSLLKKLPASWDDLRYLDGTPGDYTVLARRKGSEWFVGGITQIGRKITVNFDFLEEGEEYFAMIYKDGSTRNSVATATAYVDSTSSLEINTLDGGGFTVVLTKADEIVVPTDFTPSVSTLDLMIGESASVTYSLVPDNATDFEVLYGIADPAIAVVSSSGVVTGKKMGVTALTVTMPSIGVSKNVTVRVGNESRNGLNPVWTLVNVDPAHPVVFGEDGISLETPILSGNTNLSCRDMVLTDVPGSSYTVTLRVSGGFDSNYESAGIIVYAEDGNMIHVSRRYHSYLGGNIFCISTHDGSNYIEYAMSDDYVDDDAYLKLVVSGSSFSGYYSYDGSDWDIIDRPLTAQRTAAFDGVRVGVGAMAGTSETSAKTAVCSEFTLDGVIIPFVEEAHVKVGQGTTEQMVAGRLLEGRELDDLQYAVSDPTVATVDTLGVITGVKMGVTTLTVTDPTSGESMRIEVRVTEKPIVWTLQNGDGLVVNDPDSLTTPIKTGDTGGTIKNLYLTDAPEGDFTVTVKVSGGLSKDFQSVGIAAYETSDRIVAVTRRSHSYFGGNVFCTITRYNGSMSEPYVADTNKDADAYLKLARSGNTFTTFCSYDGVNYTKVADAVQNSAGSSPDLKIALVAFSGSYASDKSVTFSDVTINGTRAPFDTVEDYSLLLMPEDLTVVKGSMPELPGSLYLYSNMGNKKLVPVTWNTSALNVNAAGSYVIGATAEGVTGSVTVKVENGLPYDVNLDGRVDITDVTALLNVLSGLTSFEPGVTGDLDGSGTADIVDVTVLLNVLANV